MIGRILTETVARLSQDDHVAVLLSGGVDSISVALAAHRLNKKITAYSFKLDNTNNYDSDKAEEIAKIFKWKYKLIEVPTNNLQDDFLQLVSKFRCKKKTHFECVYPFMYVYPEIKEREVLSGWAADGYYGISKKAMMHYAKKGQKTRFDEFRNEYFAYNNRAGYNWHKSVADYYDKKFITPYLTEDVRMFFYDKDWEELNKPFQKHHVVNAFPEFKKFKFKKHINLQLGSGIDKLFESLLNNRTLNPKGKYKSVSGLCQSWGKKV